VISEDRWAFGDPPEVGRRRARGHIARIALGIADVRSAGLIPSARGWN
jgi:hypothetical protein